MAHVISGRERPGILGVPGRGNGSVQGHPGQRRAMQERRPPGHRVLRHPGPREAGRGLGRRRGFGPRGPAGGRGIAGLSAAAERSCIACRTRRPKGELVRVVRGAGGVAVDRTGKAQGRGAYVCRDPRCARTAARGLGRALRVTLGPDDLATLRMEIEQEMS